MPERFEPNMEDENEAAEKQYKDDLRTLGHLSEKEIDELVNFEFRTEPASVDEQVRRYYLKLKSERPQRAEQMQNDTESIIRKGITSQADARDLCFALYKYWSGFVIRFDGHSYSVSNSKLKIDGKVVE